MKKVHRPDEETLAQSDRNNAADVIQSWWSTKTKLSASYEHLFITYATCNFEILLTFILNSAHSLQFLGRISLE